ncbi:hypothetical protein HJFPF1_02233 [Paramyrothecium foliicola]|nr:hypothetical protein HJFPF1_02233 [Paramyrothecium foliicola]
MLHLNSKTVVSAVFGLLRAALVSGQTNTPGTTDFSEWFPVTEFPNAQADNLSYWQAEAQRIAGPDLWFEYQWRCIVSSQKYPEIGSSAQQDGFVKPARVFDSVFFIGESSVSAWAIDTGSGLIVIDALWNADEAEKVLIPGLQSFGYEGSDVKALIITHEHLDHFGGALYLQETFGIPVYATEPAWKTLANITGAPVRDMTLADGQVLTVGNTSLTVYSTPGHTPGTLSFFVPVYEHGERHLAGLYGGGGIPSSASDKATQIESFERFASLAEELGADVLLANHQTQDRSLPNLDVLATRQCDGANYFANKNIGYELVQSAAGASVQSSPDLDLWTRPVSPPVRDRATNFFIQQYVFAPMFSSHNPTLQSNHEYLPSLLRTQDSELGLLGTAVAAAGFAALSNAVNAPAWRAESFRLYSKAIRQLQQALQDPVQRVSDETLGAVLIMGTFETIVSADLSSMKSYSHHVIAAARCIQMRGPGQFRSVNSVKLFMHMRRIMEPFPYELTRWSEWAEHAQIDDLIPVNRFSEINGILARVRADLKYQSITDPAVVSAWLLPIDKMMEEWAQTLPASWAYESYRAIGPNGVPSSRFDMQDDTYSDPWIACIWNCYRNARLLIHESIIAATLRYGTEEQKASLQSSAKVLAAMADGVCHSVAYHLGDRRADSEAAAINRNTTVGNSNPVPGGFLLVWPLFFSGMLRTSPPEQRAWVANTMQRIGVQMGLQLALAMARLLREKALSFSHNDTFFLGEWHPN